MAGDGKSTVTANLAVAIAESGKRVVLVDGDLRKPAAAETLGLLPGVGPTDVLIGRAELGDVLQPWGETGESIRPRCRFYSSQPERIAGLRPAAQPPEGACGGRDRNRRRAAAHCRHRRRRSQHPHRRRTRRGERRPDDCRGA
ncbi:hypothetical protein [Propionibacterium sp.]|uniref:nucleotide-binding protein n=1 Tax=Propionibacterium sp. TaxID=1977903 RepID=UPI0039EBBAE3